jgi:Protein of unknown function (DUF3078)
MLIRIVVPTLFIFIALTTLGQQEISKNIDEALAGKKIEADTSKKGPWKIGGILALNLSQQNSVYWVGANEKFALNVGSSADLYANYAEKKNTWDNTLKMSYAFTHNQSQGVRKTSDFIDFYTKYGRDISKNGKTFLALIGNFRSQFTAGYDYDLDPRRRTSDFFAPATILLTPGLEWRPSKFFSLFASPVGARWVLVTNDPYSYSYPGGVRPDGSQEAPISNLYGVDPEEKVDGQFGAFVSAKFDKEILKNVLYTSRLDLFSNYLNKPQNIDIYWTSNLIFKVNKWLVLSYQWNVAYDDDFVPEGVAGPRTQFLGTFGIGVASKF